MRVEIHLLGRPRAWCDGEEVALRGRKVWLVLAVLLLGDAPVTRGRLARMLFVDAADPGASLRWNLSQLRRVLGLQLDGDPLELRVPAEVTIDVVQLMRGDADAAAAIDGLDDDLLEDVRVEPGSDLELWLDGERRRIHRLGLDVRAEAALAQLGRGDVSTALGLARDVAEAAPLDEDAATLLVRCLRAAGRIAEARTTAERIAARLRDQLGVEPSAQLWTAVAAPPGGDRRVTGRGAVVAQLDAGASAIAAGALDTGVAALRSALVAARAVREPALVARALVELGSALIHGVRGVDQEGVALLHEAVPLTQAADDAALAARTRREIGYVDLLRGRYERAGHWLDQARRIGDGAARELGWVDVYAGVCRDDVGDRAGAAWLLERATRTAQAEHDPRLEAFALVKLGRHHLLASELDAAQAALDASLRIVRSLDWTGLRAYPEALLADLLRRRGDLGGARALSEHAFVLGEQVGDPCWESVALRSLGLVAVDAGEVDEGLSLLREAPARCRRLPDTYRWVELWALDALVDVARRRHLPEAPAWAGRLDAQASALGMRVFTRRARSGATSTGPHG